MQLYRAVIKTFDAAAALDSIAQTAETDSNAICLFVCDPAKLMLWHNRDVPAR
jgi:hypothetical protein